MNYADESVRDKCRRKYRDEGVLDNPYKPYSRQWEVWANEVLKITREEIESSLYVKHAK